MISEMRTPSRLSYGRIPNLVELKDLIATQLESFNWFKTEGLRELFDEINPITDYTGKNFELKFLDYEFGQPKFSVEECRNRDMTYAAPLRIKTRLTIKETGEIKESEVYMGDFAMMTPEGTFIVNGTERVVVSQLVRSPGVYFTAAEDPNTGQAFRRQAHPEPRGLARDRDLGQGPADGQDRPQAQGPGDRAAEGARAPAAEGNRERQGGAEARAPGDVRGRRQQP